MACILSLTLIPSARDRPSPRKERERGRVNSPARFHSSLLVISKNHDRFIPGDSAKRAAEKSHEPHKLKEGVNQFFIPGFQNGLNIFVKMSFTDQQGR